MLTSRNIVNNGYWLGEGLGYTPADRLCLCVPLFHCFGCVIGVLGAYAHGACICAVEFFERSFDPAATVFSSPMTFDFIRALAYARVGREDDARHWYRLGMVHWERETADHPEAWERSDAMRWRREAEAALAK